jgi:hypothetical protein
MVGCCFQTLARSHLSGGSGVDGFIPLESSLVRIDLWGESGLCLTINFQVTTLERKTMYWIFK